MKRLAYLLTLCFFVSAGTCQEKTVNADESGVSSQDEQPIASEPEDDQPSLYQGGDEEEPAPEPDEPQTTDDDYE